MLMIFVKMVMSLNELQVGKEEFEYAEGQPDHYGWHN